MAEILWLLAVAGGPVVLGVAIAYAWVRRRRLSRRERQERDKATKELYEQDR